MRSLFIFLLIAAGLTLQAQPGKNLKVDLVDPLLSLESAIASTLANHYGILIAKSDSAMLSLDYRYRNAGFLPRVNSSAGLTLNNNDQYQKFNDGTIRERKAILSNNLNAAISLNWTLFGGLKLYASREKAVELQQVSALELQSLLLNTIAQVMNNYYGLVQQKQQLKAIEEQIQINSERVKLANYKLSIGVGTKSDLLQSKVDLNAQKAAQLEQVLTIQSLKEELNKLMGVSAGTGFEVNDSIPFLKHTQFTDLHASWVTKNPTLLMARKNIKLAELTLKERKAERWPTINFATNYNFSRLDNKAVVNPFQPLFSRNKGLNYGFTASIPLFNNFNTKKAIEQASLALNTQQLVYRSQELQINWALVQAYNEYEAQQKALALEEENIVLAKENVSIVFEVYRLNSTTLIQLKEAQKSLQDAYTRLIRARYRAKTAETELLRIKGELLK